MEGKWINEFRILAELIAEKEKASAEIHRERCKAKQKKERENPTQIEDLKRRFGVS